MAKKCHKKWQKLASKVAILSFAYDKIYQFIYLAGKFFCVFSQIYKFILFIILEV